jgi:hypothetical protein
MKLSARDVFPETVKFLKTLNYSDTAIIIANAVSVALDRDCDAINKRVKEIVSAVVDEKDALIAKYDKRNALLSKLAGMRRLALDANEEVEDIDYSALKPLVMNTLNLVYDNEIDYRDLADSLGLKIATTRNGLSQFKSKRFILAICALLDINPYIKNEQDSNS